MRHIDIELLKAKANLHLSSDILTTERNAHGLSRFTLKKYAVSPKKDCIYFIRITRNFIYLFQEKSNLEKQQRDED